MIFKGLKVQLWYVLEDNRQNKLYIEAELSRYSLKTIYLAAELRRNNPIEIGNQIILVESAIKKCVNYTNPDGELNGRNPEI